MAKKATKATEKAVKNTAQTVLAVAKKRRPAKKTGLRRTFSAENKAEQPENIVVVGPTYLTEAELLHFKMLLAKKYKEGVGDVNHIEDDAMHKSRQDAAGDLSSMPIHMADIGSDNYEQEFSLNLMDNGRELLREIVMAFERIEEGTYGMCEGTGEPIPKPRLEACPWARYCVRYAEMIEKNQVSEVRRNNYSAGQPAESDDGGENEDHERTM